MTETLAYLIWDVLFCITENLSFSRYSDLSPCSNLILKKLQEIRRISSDNFSIKKPKSCLSRFRPEKSTSF